MNRSGEAIAEAMNFYKVPIEDVVVVYDELDLPAQKYRIKTGGGPGGHNGLRSIIPLGDKFTRLRLGIGRPPHPDYDIADYVLGDLSKEELEFWKGQVPALVEIIDLCLEGKAGIAMNKFHRKD
jgi:peptidyl-tRNA hydrolase, PTH1 family